MQNNMTGQTDSLDFNFNGGGDIFGEFTPDLSSLQKPNEPVEPENQEDNDTEDDINIDLPASEDDNILDEQEDDNSDDGDTDDNGNDDVNNNDDGDDLEYSYLALVDHLTNEGLIDSLDGEDLEDSPEALEKAVHKTVINGIQSYKDSIPDEGKQFLDYLERGGDPSKFFQALEKPIDLENIDLTDEENQKLVYKEYLKSIDWSDEEIEEELRDAEDNLQLERKAKTASNKLDKVFKEKRQRLIQEQEQAIQEQQQQVENYINQIKSTIESSTQIAGLTVSPSDKSEFEKYLLAKDKDGLTQYEKELNENPIKTQLELAYLKYKKYDFSKVAKQIKTEETKRIKNLIKNKGKSNGRSPQIQNNNNGSGLGAFKSLM